MNAAQQLAEAVPKRMGRKLSMPSTSPSPDNRVPITLKAEPQLAATPVNAGTLLVVGADDILKGGLCASFAEDLFSVVVAESLREAAELATTTELLAGWVDLDLPGDAGWEVAEWLLGQKPAVRVLMLTARAEHHEISAAIRAGVVFEKALGAAGLLQATIVLLSEPAPQAEGRFALQLAWLRRAKPYRWDAPAIQSYQHWGINE